MVLDGFGCRAEGQYNAIAAASTPALDHLFATSPWTSVEASGLRVGLPEGQMGNSEVGHLNIGAGRVVDQDMVRITKASRDGSIGQTAAFRATCDRLLREERALHLVGLLSDGGVHSLQEHLHGLIEAADRAGLGALEGRPRIFVHAILDGRDVPPVSALDNLARLETLIARFPQVALSTVIGRYYTMDRDRRWDRVQRGYDLMTDGVGTRVSNIMEAVQFFNHAGKTDEFMEPLVLTDDGELPRGLVSDGDSILFCNFRADRMRQIVMAFNDEAFTGFNRTVKPRVELLSMVRYNEEFTLPVLFPPPVVKRHLGEVFSEGGLRQLRIAETEKYAHVTFFFNGGSDTASPGEERILVPSPKVATYDLQPSMSLPELADRVIAEIQGRVFDVIIMNIANPDMVGHTGVMPAAVSAVEATDFAVGRIAAAVDSVGGMLAITADHGNCEIMFDPSTGQPHTAHTTSPVPLLIQGPGMKDFTLRDGGALENVAPTMLELMALPKPPEMTASSLLVWKPQS